MARQGRAKPAPRKAPEPRPEPLPPERRTLGQLVAETIRFYQQHFFQSLPLGISVAAITQLTFAFGHRHVEPRGHPPPKWFSEPKSILGGGIETTILLGSLLLTVSYIAGIVLVTGLRPDARRLLTAYVLGVLVFVPTPLLAAILGLLALPALAYLAFFGWVVPVALVEGKGYRESFRRSVQLGRADYVHALGGLATLVILFYVIRLMLALLLRGGGEITERSAAFLADLVLSPMLFLGSALLYLDQAARVKVRSTSTPRPKEA
jgi:hypothetical protein